MDRKFDIIKHKRIISSVAYIVSAIYFLFAFLFASSITATEQSKLQEFDRLLARVESVNNSLSGRAPTSGNNKSDSEEVVSAEPLYSDGKTAFLEAFNNTFSANSFYCEALISTQSVASIAGIKATTQIDINYTGIKFPNNHYYESCISKLIAADDAAKPLENIIKKNSNQGSKQLKIDEEAMYRFDTNNIFIDKRGKLCADFTNVSKRKVNTKKYLLLLQNYYIINENTLKDENVKYFYVKYKNGIPSYYYVQVELSGKEYISKYKYYLKNGSGSITEPNVTSTIVNLVINSKGFISGIIGIDNYDVVLSADDGKLLTAYTTCKQTLNMVISQVNENIDFEVGEFYD